MRDGAVVIGVDIGTTSTRAIAYEREGRVRAQASKGYELRSPLPGRAEQDPREILAAVVECVGRVKAGIGASEVRGVSFSAAMHSLLALDANGDPITPSLTYADARASAQAARIRSEHDWLAIQRRTGTPIHAMSPFAKLVWFGERDPETFDRAASWVSVKEYVLRELFGEPVVDHSIASATGLFDVRELRWDREVLGILDLPEERLSRPVPTKHVIEGLDTERAGEMGLDPATPFVVGANDGVLANLGVGAVDPGVVAVSIGTSGAVRSVVQEPEVDDRGRLFCYVLEEGVWVVGGPINNGGLALSWLRENILADLDDEPFEAMDRLAGQAPPGSDGLIFLPYLTGERAPQWDSEARAVFFGLGRRHDRRHLVRAVMEGVAYQLRSVSGVLSTVTGAPSEIRATGGFVASGVWRQVLADVLGHEVLFPESAEGSCWGAALLGMKALGIVDDLEAARAMVEVSHHNVPDRAAKRRHEEYAAVFERLYGRLAPEFQALAEIEDGA